MPRSPLTEQYQRIMSVVDQIHSWSEDERNFLRDLFWPEQSQPATKKKPKKRSTSTSSKSARAAGMAAQLNRNLDQRRKAEKCTLANCDMLEHHPIHHNKDSKGYHPFTTVRINVDSDGDDKCSKCGNGPDSNFHHLANLPGYHPFESLATDVAGESQPPSSGIVSDSVGDAHHIASGGD